MPNPNTFKTGEHGGLADVRHRSLQNCLGNRALTAAGLDIDTDANDLETNNALTFIIDGVYYSLAASTGNNVTCADYYGDTDVQAAGTTCWYAICIDSAGAITAYKGKDDETTDLPRHPKNLCCFGLIKIVTVGVTFTMGTTDYSASGITDTYYDVSCLPSTAP